MPDKIKEPTFPKVVIFSPSDIRDIIKGFGPKMTQEKFARYFPVSLATVKAWLSGNNPPYGPSSSRLQELKAWTDQEAAAKQAVFDKMMNKKNRR
jgi:DNA-binding transcriptional regulator YiaG